MFTPIGIGQISRRWGISDSLAFREVRILQSHKSFLCKIAVASNRVIEKPALGNNRGFPFTVCPHKNKKKQELQGGGGNKNVSRVIGQELAGRMTSSVCQAHGHERPESSTWNYQTRTHFVFHVAFNKKTKKLNNGWRGNLGVLFPLYPFCLCLVIVTLPFFSLLSNWRFPLVLSFLFFNIWLLTKKITHTHRERQEKEKNIRGENYVNNPQGPVVNSRVTRLLLVMVYSFTTTTYSFFFLPPCRHMHIQELTNKIFRSEM